MLHSGPLLFILIEMFVLSQGPASGKFKSQSNYNSAFKFNNHDHVSVRMEDNDVFDRTGMLMFTH